MNETPLPLMVCAMITVGLPFVSSASAKAFCSAANVVAVHFDGVPAEAAPLVRQRTHSHDVFHEAVELNLVVIDDRHHVVDFCSAGNMAASQTCPS